MPRTERHRLPPTVRILRLVEFERPLPFEPECMGGQPQLYGRTSHPPGIRARERIAESAERRGPKSSKARSVRPSRASMSISASGISRTLPAASTKACSRLAVTVTAHICTYSSSKGSKGLENPHRWPRDRTMPLSASPSRQNVTSRPMTFPMSSASIPTRSFNVRALRRPEREEGASTGPSKSEIHPRRPARTASSGARRPPAPTAQPSVGEAAP